VASVKECRAAITLLGERLAGADESVRVHVADRTVSCWITDLDVTFRGRLAGGELADVTDAVSSERADIRLSVSSDDLVDLVHGRLSFAHAWATGRLRLDASFRDLMRLRSLMS